MTTKEYNGWSNYETWLVKLWMDNEEGSHNYWNERATDLFDATEASRFNTKDQQARIDLADQLKEQHEESYYEALPKHLHASFIMDLLNSAMSEVNWHEIAGSLLEDNCEEYGKEKEAA